MSLRSRRIARSLHLIAAVGMGACLYVPRLRSGRYEVVIRTALFPSLLLTGATMWHGARLARRLRRIGRIRGDRRPSSGVFAEPATGSARADHGGNGKGRSTPRPPHMVSPPAHSGRADAGDLDSHAHTHGLIDPTIKRSRAGLRATAEALLVLSITATAQAFIFAASGSIALLADLVHNFGDAATAIPLGVAFTLRSLRAERIAGLLVILAIFVSACVAGYEAIDRLLHPREVEAVGALAAAGLIGFGGNWWAAEIRTRAGQKLRSPALVADGNHARTDAYVSLGVVASAVAVASGAQVADPLIGLAITAVILRITRQSWRTVGKYSENMPRPSGEADRRFWKRLLSSRIKARTMPCRFSLR
jgi:Co/Zn/Cd efflux system component